MQCLLVWGYACRAKESVPELTFVSDAKFGSCIAEQVVCMSEGMTCLLVADLVTFVQKMSVCSALCQPEYLCIMVKQHEPPPFQLCCTFNTC